MLQSEILERSLTIMDSHWIEAFKYTSPNPATYPWMWLWDSCFHAIIWDSLNDDRSIQELSTVLQSQLPSGALPHMSYFGNPTASEQLWGTKGHSTITQPPMYGYAASVLAKHNRHLDDSTQSLLKRALEYLYAHRLTDHGLLEVYHPWETGCDDSPRWEALQPNPFSRKDWLIAKMDMVSTFKLEDEFIASSSMQPVCPAGFNALAAWNTLHAGLLLKDTALLQAAQSLISQLDLLWDPAYKMWSDTYASGEHCSNRPTLESLLPVLVTPYNDRVQLVFEMILSPADFGLPFGPSGVSVRDPSFDPNGYWRGSSWPHLIYLFIIAAVEHRLPMYATRLAQYLQKGVLASEYAEYWNPYNGSGLGAVPQSWSALAAVVDEYIW